MGISVSVFCALEKAYEMRASGTLRRRVVFVCHLLSTLTCLDSCGLPFGAFEAAVCVGKGQLFRRIARELEDCGPPMLHELVAC